MPSSAQFPPTQCKLFFALLWNKDLLNIEDFKLLLEKEWGKIKRDFRPSYFPMVRYYQKEMGESLDRAYLFIEGHFDREVLSKAKNWAMDFEQKTSIIEKRAINIDPGLLCLEQVLLISTKPFSHRISMPGNLYIELTYIYENNHYKCLPWTYPDYAQEEVIKVFEQER